MQVERFMHAVSVALSAPAGGDAMETLEQSRAAFDADLNATPSSGSSEDDRVTQLRREAGVA